MNTTGECGFGNVPPAILPATPPVIPTARSTSLPPIQTPSGSPPPMPGSKPASICPKVRKLLKLCAALGVAFILLVIGLGVLVQLSKSAASHSSQVTTLNALCALKLPAQISQAQSFCTAEGDSLLQF